MNTSIKNSVTHIQPREMEMRKFYCLVGILLACVAILFALGVKPVNLYHSEDSVQSGDAKNLLQQTAPGNKIPSLALSQ